MLFHWIVDHFGVPGLWLALVLFGVLAYIVLSGTSYLTCFYWQRDRFHPQYRANRDELRRSVKWALYSIIGNAVLMVPVELLIISGDSQIYYGIDQYGWFYLVVSGIVVLAITETLIYWIHRSLHTRVLYGSLHKHHHQFREPTPLVSVAFHPLDSFAQAVPYHLCAFLFPMNVWLYHGFVMLVTIWAVLIHDRMRWVPTDFVNHTGCHMAHHWYYAYNYGQFFTFWDRICGTYKDSGELPERFAASWSNAKMKMIHTSRAELVSGNRTSLRVQFCESRHRIQRDLER